MENTRDKMLGCIYGAIVGDAFGGPYEFATRGTYKISHEYIYNRNFNLLPGSYTDDTSTMFCLMESLLDKGGFDKLDQIQKYSDWYKNGRWSVNGACFDIGKTTRRAINEYLGCGDDRYYGQLQENSSGNGGIMRLPGIPIFYSSDLRRVRKYSRLSSGVTHASPECLDSAELLGRIIHQLLNGTSKQDLFIKDTFESDKIQELSTGKFTSKSRDQIQTTGYVVHTLEAALYTFTNTSSFVEGLHLLAEMGDDVDTVLCVYGCLAGAHYGFSNIPSHLIDGLQNKTVIEPFIKEFLSRTQKQL